MRPTAPLAFQTIPGPQGFDLLSSSAKFARDPIAFFVDSYQRYGSAFRLQAFDFNLTVMLGPQAHRAVFVDHADKLSARVGYSLLLPLMDDALLVSDGAHHAQQRRLIAPAFHHGRVARYIAIMQEQAQRSMARWHDGDVIDVYEASRRMTLQIICVAILGVDIRDDYEAMARTITHTFDYYTQPGARKLFKIDLPFMDYGRSKRARQQLDALIFKLIHERRASAIKSDDVLSWLIEAEDEDGTKLSDQDIRDQVLLLIYAGHDTATCSLTWALDLLARHTQVAQTLAEEICAHGDNPISMNSLREMSYLDMVLSEVLRLYPPVWIGMRGVTQDFEFDGRVIPAGTRVMYSPGASHRLPQYFEEPLKFDPLRFSSERKGNMVPNSYVPFGGGARLCIGMPFAIAELKVLLLGLLGRFRFETVSDKPTRLRYNPTLAPARGVRLQVRRTS
jgi:cytochrome P450